MAKSETLTASKYGALVGIGSDQINCSDETQKIFELNSQQVWPDVALVSAMSIIGTDTTINMGRLAVLSEIVKKLGLKPGDANPSANLLPAETGLGGLALVGLMADNGDALVTIPHNLPVRVRWNTLAEQATETEIQKEFINVHHLFKTQGTHDFGFQDWRAPNMKCGDNYRADESRMLWKFSNAGGKKLFDKSGAWPGSAFWAARRHSNLEACYVWADRDHQHCYWPTFGDSGRELPARPVRRVELRCAQSVSPSA